jgi:5'-nucleotidase
MRLLLTNDDGIDAPGLAALEQACRGLGSYVVLAPHQHCSGCSHRATTDRELTVYPRGDGRLALDGTPVDCTRVALVHWPEPVDWVLAGINEGGNLGADIYLSGTVAAVREAALLGKPAVAISHYRRAGSSIDWDRAARWTRAVLARLLAEGLQPGAFYNVNLPDVAQHEPPEIVFCDTDPNPLPVRYREEAGRLLYHACYHQRPRQTGHDVDVCFSGRISISRVRLAPAC